MSIAGLKYGILRLINYTAGANKERFERSVKYITNAKKTADEFTIVHYMDIKKPVASLDALEYRWHNSEMSGRLFKHGIISFGSSRLSTADALAIITETMAFYDDYPYIAALHTDIPHRLHAHFLLAMRNIKTGKKFSQGSDDLVKFRQHYHSMAIRYHLLGLRDCIDMTRKPYSDVPASTDIGNRGMQEGCPVLRARVAHSSEYQAGTYSGLQVANDIEMRSPCFRPCGMEEQEEYSGRANNISPVNSGQQIRPGQTDMVNQIFQTAQADFEYFFTQGFMGRLSK